MWYGVIAALGSGIRVIAPDLPGFGRTPVLKGKGAMDAYAGFIADTLDANEAENAIVAGMSMGGYIALAFAEKYPQRVVGLGLISSQAAADTDEARKARQEMIKKISEEGPGFAAKAILPKMFATESPKNPDLANFPIEGADKAGVDGLTFALQAMAKRPDRTEFVKNLEIPLLVVHGAEDKIIPFAKARAMAELVKFPTFVEARGAGHATPLEAPDTVAQGLLRLTRICRENSKTEQT